MTHNEVLFSAIVLPFFHLKVGILYNTFVTKHDVLLSTLVLPFSIRGWVGSGNPL